MNSSLFFRLLLRQVRGARSRFALLTASVAVGVAAVVGVLSITNAVEAGIRARSRELLGGDLSIESRRALPEILPSVPDAQRAGAKLVRTWTLASMVRSDGNRTRLAELKAIDQTHGSYPLAGKLVLDPPRPLSELLDDQSALVARELLTSLGLKIGDTLHVGGLSLRIRGVVEQEPDPLGFSFTLGPRVLISYGALARTNLLSFGNRVRYRALLTFAGARDLGQLRALKRQLEGKLPGGGEYVTVEVYDEAQPALRQMLARVEHYAGLVALLSLLVASVGVAQTVGAWLRQSAPQTAILRCLGLRPRDVFALYLSLVTSFALLGSLLGSGVAALAPRLVAHYRPELVPPAIGAQFPWLAALRGSALGVAVPIVCSLFSLTSAWRAPAVAVLRSDAMPLPIPLRVRAPLALIAASFLFLVCWWQSGDPRLALCFALGLSLLALTLIALARGLSWLLARLPRRRLPPFVWHGLAALTRPGSGVTGSVVALGMGALIVLSIALSSELMQRALASALPERAPSIFLVDIQPDQWPGVAEICRGAGGTQVESVPVVMARLRTLDGHSPKELIKTRSPDPNEPSRAQRMATREQRISWAEQLPADNRIIAGKLWSDPERDEVSVEAEFARDLGIHLGSVLRFDVQGSLIDLHVTSLRTVEWRSFSTNFFLIAEPGALEGAPYFRLAALRAEGDIEARIEAQLAQQFPNVTVLRVRNLIVRARDMFEQLARGVQLLGAFAILTGLLTLTGSVASSQLRRMREVALLKTLGVSRAGVVLMFGLEYALHGFVAGTIGAGAAYTATWIVAREVLELKQLPSWQISCAAVLITSALALIAGLLASVRALLVRPIQVLRGRG